MATTIVSRTQSGSESAAGRRTFTFSAWIKRTGLGSCELFGSDSDGARSNNYFIIDFNGSNNLDISEYISGSQFRLITNRVFRDTSAWYHLVLAVDTTQGTSSNRIKIYINGVQETSFSTANYPSQDYQTKMFAQNKIHAFGRSGGQFDGSISHCHAAEGTAYAPTVFGSTDATTGEWKINTSPSVSYGTNGFFLFKDDNSVNNQAGNSSGNFAVTAGTLTKTEDNPSNVFATGNPLIGVHSNGNTLVPTFSNGNNTATATGSAWRVFKSTLSASSGKYYAEFKWISDSNTRYAYIGVYNEDDYANKSTGYPYIGDMLDAHCYYSENGNYYTNGGSTSFGNTFSNGSIIGVAMDLDNSKIYFSKDGTWQGSANPTNGTGGKSLTANKTYTFGVLLYSVGSIVYSANFGNGYFGTTAVSSAGTNASNNGIFEYDVPSGFTALSTKGLNL